MKIRSSRFSFGPTEWFLNIQPSTGTLRGTVWNDLNSNGQIDAGESGLADAQVGLYDTLGQLLAVTVAAQAPFFLRLPRLSDELFDLVEAGAAFGKQLGQGRVLPEAQPRLHQRG